VSKKETDFGLLNAGQLDRLTEAFALSDIDMIEMRILKRSKLSKLPLFGVVLGFKTKKDKAAFDVQTHGLLEESKKGTDELKSKCHGVAVTWLRDIEEPDGAYAMKFIPVYECSLCHREFLAKGLEEKP